MDEDKKILCPHCKRYTKAGNFCTRCGQKIALVCDCWVTNSKRYCPRTKCMQLYEEMLLEYLLSKIKQSHTECYGIGLNPLFQKRMCKGSSGLQSFL